MYYTLNSSAAVPAGVQHLTIGINCGKIGNVPRQNLQTLTVLPHRTTQLDIPQYAFRNCINLKSINFNNAWIEFGAACFIGCTSLESLELPNSSPEKKIIIFQNVFKGCTALKKITLSPGVFPMASRMFVGCDAIRHIRIPSLRDLNNYFPRSWIRDTLARNADIRMSIIHMGKTFDWLRWQIEEHMKYSQYVFLNSTLRSTTDDLDRIIVYFRVNKRIKL